MFGKSVAKSCLADIPLPLEERSAFFCHICILSMDDLVHGKVSFAFVFVPETDTDNRDVSVLRAALDLLVQVLGPDFWNFESIQKLYISSFVPPEFLAKFDFISTGYTSNSNV